VDVGLHVSPRFCKRALSFFYFVCICVLVCVCVCVWAGGGGGEVPRREDRRVEKKSNHLIAAFFISIFYFMAAEGRRATLEVIHGRWGGP